VYIDPISPWQNKNTLTKANFTHHQWFSRGDTGDTVMMRSNRSLQVNRNRLEVSHGVPNLWNSNHSRILPMHFRTSGKINDLDWAFIPEFGRVVPCFNISAFSFAWTYSLKTDVHKKKNACPNWRMVVTFSYFVVGPKSWPMDGFQNFPSMDSISLKPSLPILSQIDHNFHEISQFNPHIWWFKHGYHV